LFLLVYHSLFLSVWCLILSVGAPFFLSLSC
jgi:hypothetical protein